MIYFNKCRRKKKRFGIKIEFKRKQVLPFKRIFHMWIILKLGKNRYWIGMNRIRRIVKDKLYRIDNIEMYRTNKKKEYQFRKIK